MANEQANIQLSQAQLIKMSKIEVNKGQIEGVPANPRFIKDAKFHKLVQSIKDNPEMLSLRELMVYPHEDKYVLIGGNMRYRAMKELGYTSAPCKVVPDSATAEQLRAYVIKDNNSFGEWDMDMLANEWNAEELDLFGIDLPEVEDVEEDVKEAKDDGFDETKEKIPERSKAGDIWQLGNHRLMCGDSTKAEDVDRLMGGVTADLVFTDPPYNVDVSNSKGMKIENDNMSSTAFRSFLSSAFSNISRSLKPGGAFYVWYAEIENVNFRLSIEENAMMVKQNLIWVKNSFNFGRQDYKWQHEPCYYGWKEGAGHYFVDEFNHATVMEDQLDIEKMSKKELQDVLTKMMSADIATSVIHENKPLRNDLHPTMKPLPMCGELIRHSSRKGEIVLDLFGGSGSTMMACDQLDRTCYMMEYDPHYADVILFRWEKLTGGTAVKIEPKND